MDEFKKIHEDQLRHTVSGFYANEFWFSYAAADAAKIDYLIYSVHGLSKITISIFEWGSGLG